MPPSRGGDSAEARGVGGRGHRGGSRSSLHARLEAVASPRSCPRARELRRSPRRCPFPPCAGVVGHARRPLAFVALLLLSGAAVAATGRVTVPAEATATGQVIRLGDIALLEGPATAALGDVTLGPAPGAGESRMLEGARVLDALRRAGADLAEITYTIPPVIRVRRASQEVSEAAGRQNLRAVL